MKKRTASPLLRASALMTGSALFGCSVSAQPSAEPTEDSPTEPLELADTHRVTLQVLVPDDAKPTGPIRVELRAPGAEGPPLATREFPLTGRSTAIDWDVDPSVPLTTRLHVRAYAPVADAPSPRDLIAEATGAITSLLTLKLHPQVALVEVALNSTVLAEARRPVYANTKGSHHMQDRHPRAVNEPPPPAPPPPPVTTITVHAPNGAPVRVLNITVADGDNQVFNKAVIVPSFPAELVLHPPKGATWPEAATVRFVANDGSPNAFVGELRVNFGAQASVTLTPQP